MNNENFSYKNFEQLKNIISTNDRVNYKLF